MLLGSQHLREHLRERDVVSQPAVQRHEGKALPCPSAAEPDTTVAACSAGLQHDAIHDLCPVVSLIMTLSILPPVSPQQRYHVKRHG